MEFLPIKGDSLVQHRTAGRTPYMVATLDDATIASDGEYMPSISLSLIFLSETEFATNYEYDPSFRQSIPIDPKTLRVIRKKKKNGISENRRQLQLAQVIQEDLSWELSNNGAFRVE